MSWKVKDKFKSILKFSNSGEFLTLNFETNCILEQINFYKHVLVIGFNFKEEKYKLELFINKQTYYDLCFYDNLKNKMTFGFDYLKIKDSKKNFNNINFFEEVK